MHDTHEPAQVCLNGHMTNDATRSEPEESKAFCPKCGERTIQTCPACNAIINGRRIRQEEFETITVGCFTPPPYCFHCGKPYPWTTSRIQAAIELFTESGGIGSSQSGEVGQDIKDLVSETPRTPLAILRIQKLLSKVGKPVGDAVQGVLVGIVSESIKRKIWPS